MTPNNLSAPRRALGLLAVLSLLLPSPACISGKGGGVQDGAVSPGDGAAHKEGGGGTDGGKKDGGKKDVGSGADAFGPFVPVTPETFWMGANSNEYCSTLADPETRHQVTLTHKFEVQKTEVTQGQFLKLMGYNPSKFSGTDATDKSTYCGGTSCADNPVEQVSWHEAAYYCNMLSEKLGLKDRCYDCTGTLPGVTCTVHWSFDSSGKTLYDCPAYRLPTEAEWEYAYRSKTTTSHYNGETTSTNCYGCSTPHDKANAIAWFCQNSDARTHATGQRMPNGLGLLDMAGNVAEWTADWYKEDLGNQPAQDPLNKTASTYRVARGGSYDSQPRFMRAASRQKEFPTNHPRQVGFRVTRTK